LAIQRSPFAAAIDGQFTDHIAIGGFEYIRSFPAATWAKKSRHPQTAADSFTDFGVPDPRMVEFTGDS
jgi:hypothetical protein